MHRKDKEEDAVEENTKEMVKEDEAKLEKEEGIIKKKTDGRTHPLSTCACRSASLVHVLHTHKSTPLLPSKQQRSSRNCFSLTTYLHCSECDFALCAAEYKTLNADMEQANELNVKTGLKVVSNKLIEAGCASRNLPAPDIPYVPTLPYHGQ